MESCGSRRQDRAPTKPGYHKGCFGSPTLAKRQEARRHLSGLYRSSRSRATAYFKRRMRDSAKYKDRMTDMRVQQRELDRLTQREYSKLRARDRKKHIARAARKT